MTDPAAGDRCLVTGASGFIGGHLTKRLVEEGYRVRCLVRPTSDVAALERLGVELVRGDLASSAALAGAVEGCRYVVHSAAMVSDWGTVKEIRQVNVLGTRNLLTAAAGASVERFVQFSTTDVYGYPGERAVDEVPRASGFQNWYAQTKLEAEQAARQVEATSGLKLVILRPATVYGPGSKEVVGEMAAALRGGHMLLIAGGSALAGLTYVENVIDAAMLALTHPGAAGGAFNVTDGLPITWRAFLDDLADGLGYRRVRWSLPYGMARTTAIALEQAYRSLRRMTGLTLPPLLSRQAVDVLGRPQDFSNHKLRAELGWTPRVDYAAGLTETLVWLREEYLTRG